MLRYEVDLPTLRGWVPEADGRHLGPFCENLGREVNAEDGPVRVVPTFRALNDPRDAALLAWGWPTTAQWRRAVGRTFGVSTLPTRSERR